MLVVLELVVARELGADKESHGATGDAFCGVGSDCRLVCGLVRFRIAGRVELMLLVMFTPNGVDNVATSLTAPVDELAGTE